MHCTILSLSGDEIHFNLQPSREKRKALPKSHGVRIGFWGRLDFEVTNDGGDEHLDRMLVLPLKPRIPKHLLEALLFRDWNDDDTQHGAIVQRPKGAYF